MESGQTNESVTNNLQTSKHIVLLADESLYDTWIFLNFDIKELEKVESSIGPVIATDTTFDSMFRKLPQKHRGLDSAQSLIWQTKFRQDNTKYRQILSKSSSDLEETLCSIEEECKHLLSVAHKIDAGVSRDDALLVINAKWIRLNTSFEPIVVSDDRDLLTTCHLISSCYGLTIGLLSVFEILRLMELSLALPVYCEYRELKSLKLGVIDQRITKQELEEEISKLLRKATISCHPTLGRNDRVSRIMRT
jgi:hypothetical protein